MSRPAVQVAVADDGVARVTLDRAERHNAFDEAMVADLAAALRRIGAHPSARVVILSARGPSFCAGADLEWMRRMADASEDAGLADALALARMMALLDGLAVPTLALVHGRAFGVGVGLVAACDVALATPEASFRLSEVRLGLVPSVVAPYVVAAIGPRPSRRYALTAEELGAHEARRLGLVHEVVPAAGLEEEGRRLAEAVCRGAPRAQRAAKDLIRLVARRPLDEELLERTARDIAMARSSREGREGVSAFLQKRAPHWSPE